MLQFCKKIGLTFAQQNKVSKQRLNHYLLTCTTGMAPSAMSCWRLKKNCEAISHKLNLEQMSSDTWGIRYHFRGASCRIDMWEKLLRGGKKERWNQACRWTFQNFSAYLFKPVSRKPAWSRPCCPLTSCCPSSSVCSGNWIRGELLFWGPCRTGSL